MLPKPIYSDNSEHQINQGLLDQVDTASQTLGGYPCFLRTGLTSGKHDWEKTCYLKSREHILDNIFNLVDYSEMFSIMGLVVDVLAVRQLIPTSPAFQAFHGLMPIVREFRIFANESEVTHIQPYWPPDSIENPDRPDWQQRLAKMSRFPDRFPGKDIRKMSVVAAKACGGEWSVDWLQDRYGNWWLTDMALAEQSFRWTPKEIEE